MPVYKYATGSETHSFGGPLGGARQALATKSPTWNTLIPTITKTRTSW